MKQKNTLRGVIALLCFAPSFINAQQVFSNEIHYDNAGVDANEQIEVFGPAGTDLSGWSIVLYDGNTGGAYYTISLSGIIPNQCNISGQNYGTLVFGPPVAITGIQNGNGFPDGWALVNGTVVKELLSYEGVFTAVGGPANGMLSTNIGVEENGSGTADGSIQLTNTGWVVNASANSFGSCNSSQILPIEFASFSTIVRDGEVDLLWSTASEKNNAYFEIERASDGKNFEMIGQIKGAGDSNRGETYRFTDQAPVEGINYYRLRQVDYDGSFEYSIVRMARIGDPTTLLVYPNPATTSELQVIYTTGEEGEALLSLTDISGKDLVTKRFNINKGTNQMPLSMGDVPNGIYILKITGISETITEKIIIRQ